MHKCFSNGILDSHLSEFIRIMHGDDGETCLVTYVRNWIDNSKKYVALDSQNGNSIGRIQISQDGYVWIGSSSDNGTTWNGDLIQNIAINALSGTSPRFNALTVGGP